MPRIPGLTITEQAQASFPTVSSGKIDNILMVVTRATAGKGSAADNTPVKVSTIAEVTALIGTIPTVSLDSFERIRSIATTATIWMIAGSDLDATDNEVADVIAGINAALKFPSLLPLCVLIVPEGFTQAVQADRLAIYNAGQAMAATDKWDFIHVWSLPATVTTAAAAQTEGSTLNSSQGNSSVFHGWSKNASNRDVPLAADAAAWLVQKNQTSSGFYGWAGLWATVSGFSTAYAVSETEWSTLLTAGINVAWQTGASGEWTIHGDATRSTDTGWTSVASRLAFSVVGDRIQTAMNAFLWEAENPPAASSSGDQGDSIARQLGAIRSIMQQAISDGAVSYPPAWKEGDPVYRIVNKINANGFLAPAEIRFYPVRLRRSIALILTNTATP